MHFVYHLSLGAALLLPPATTFASELSTPAQNEGDYSGVKIEAQTASAGLAVTGRVIPQDGALAIESARVQGRITNILRREGDTITPGTPLFEISSPECFSLLDEKRVAQTRALADFQDSVRRREERLNLSFSGDHCRIVATSSGILAKRNVESGGAFNIGDALATVVDIKRLSIELDIPERKLMTVHVKQPVKIQLASNPETTYRTEIQQILPSIDTATRTGKIRLRPVKLPSGATLDALVFAEVETGEREQLLQVPSSALVFDHGRQFVIKKVAKQISAVPVTIVNETDRFSTIRPVKENDLHLGDEVVGKAAIYAFRTLNHGSMP